MKLNYEYLWACQKYWKDTKEISDEKANKLIDLSNKFIKRVKNNGDEVKGITLLYPEDCEDYDVFTDFAFVMFAYIRKREEKGFQMEGWGLNHEINVE